MASGPDNRDFAISFVAHVVLFLMLTVSAYFSKPMAVFENTDKQDVISAVVLGDTPDSRIVPQQVAQTPPPEMKPEKKVVEKAAPVPVPEVSKKVEIALSKPVKPKKVKVVNEDDLAKEFLADIKQLNKKVKSKKHKRQKELAAKFEKELKLQAERTLRQQLLEEDIRLKGERARLAQGEVNKYKALIIQAISENWIIPTQSDKKLTSELMIRLSPGGTVLDVQVTRSSGDPALDSSARAAVLKASPLPVPRDPEAFQAFKRFVLKVKPENVV